MSAKKWRIGILVTVIFSLATAGSGLAAGMKWQAFVAVLCTALYTNLQAYLMKHPVETIQEETIVTQTQQTKTTTTVETKDTSK